MASPKKVSSHVRFMALAQEERAILVAALRYVAAIGGNLPDDRLTNRTGPNDAAHRGLMYCTARARAQEALNQIGESISDSRSATSPDVAAPPGVFARPE